MKSKTLSLSDAVDAMLEKCDTLVMSLTMTDFQCATDEEVECARSCGVGWLTEEELTRILNRLEQREEIARNIARSMEKIAIIDGVVRVHEISYPKLVAECAALRDALKSMVLQHAYRNDGDTLIRTGGLSANEEAFEALCLDDPHPLTEGGELAPKEAK